MSLRPTPKTVEKWLVAADKLAALGFVDWGVVELAVEVRALRELVTEQAAHLRNMRDECNRLEAERDRLREAISAEAFERMEGGE